MVFWITCRTGLQKLQAWPVTIPRRLPAIRFSETDTLLSDARFSPNVAKNLAEVRLPGKSQQYACSPRKAITLKVFLASKASTDSVFFSQLTAGQEWVRKAQQKGAGDKDGTLTLLR